MKILIDITCKLKWNENLVELNSNIFNENWFNYSDSTKFNSNSKIGLRFSWGEMGWKLVEKLLRICLQMWCCKKAF
jgi:hypothetical protein